MEYPKFFHKFAFTHSSTFGYDIKKWLLRMLSELGVSTVDTCCEGLTIDSKIAAAVAVSTALSTQSGTYTEYVALLTQTSTSAPVATVLHNTLGTVTPNYTSPGIYTLDSTALFTGSKTELLITNTKGVQYNMSITKGSSSIIIINTWDGTGAGTLANALMTDTPVTIRVWA